MHIIRMTIAYLIQWKRHSAKKTKRKQKRNKNKKQHKNKKNESKIDSQMYVYCTMFKS